MMDLREPKKKKRVRLQAQDPLPIKPDDNGEWRVYTAHLSASGTCIVDPVEMKDIYSMGFFGKGSLSRSFPSFGRRRFGVPPIIRNRQWIRRQRWLEELQNLNEDANSDDLEIVMGNGTDDNLSGETVEEESCPDKAGDSISEIPADPEEPREKETDENHSTILDKEKSLTEKSTENNDSKAQKDEKTTVESRMNDDSSMELVTDEKSAKLDSKASEEPEEQKKKEKIDENSSIEIVEDIKSQESTTTTTPPKVTTTILNEIEANSSIEFIDGESCVKKAKMDNNEKKNIDEGKDESSVICDESVNVDEVLLDSTEDEEICEIVEKEPNDENSSVLDDIHVLNDSIFPKKFQNRSINAADDECIIEEETNPYELLVLPDTDSETDDYLKNVKSRIERDGFPVNETLHLTFEETFFLMYGLGCLQLIHYDGSIFSISNAWNYFQQQDKYFIQKYVVYHYFRSKGWIVKPGMKFGGDFLLYKQGPPFYHASYIVVIEVMDADTLIRDDMKSLRKITWKNLLGLERLSETIAKEILFAQILWPSSILRNDNSMLIEALSEFTVRELLWRRWNPKRRQDIAPVDEEDSSDSM